MKKRLILCADDFALSNATSAAILGLLDAGRLSAVSVMTQSRLWKDYAKDLTSFEGIADIGLHLNLTTAFSGFPARSLSYWIFVSLSHSVAVKFLCQTFMEQIERFGEEYGRFPDFIDGHQHVHALPVIREALFETIVRCWKGEPLPYIRAPDCLCHHADAPLKGGLVRLLSAGFSRGARRYHLHYPRWFGGLYSFSTGVHYPIFMKMWLKHCVDNSLLMCHPGLSVQLPDDPIAMARYSEYLFFQSPAFVEMCEQENILLSRWVPPSS